ncbi:MAG: ankyrin repeat domain-containing protein [Planctomycetales bacterium]|nr:ankyrin repeat domain-containing protein [Planctomycetales bacterium]
MSSSLIAESTPMAKALVQRVAWLMLIVLIDASAMRLAGAETPLADAAERGDWRAVETLVAARTGERRSLDEAQVDGMTALHWAAHHDHLATALSLLEAGAAADVRTRYGVAPLAIAATNGNARLVERLLSAGADVESAQAHGETALMIAARVGVAATAAALLKRGAKVEAKLPGGETPLMLAAHEGHADVVQLLLDHGADRQTTLKSGFNAFLFAARQGQREVLQVLLKSGADVNVTIDVPGGGKTSRRGTGAVMLAVENGHYEAALDLIRAGADPNDQRSGFTPLHALTWVRKPNRGDGPDGDPPPSDIGMMTSLEFARELVRLGANVNARLERGASGRGKLNLTGATPFLMACKTADLPYLKLLRELGADWKIANADRCGALMAAAGIGTLAPTEEAGTEEEALAVAEWLLELGANVNDVDDNGETAMHGAAYKSLPNMVRWLAKHGANPEVWGKRNKYGWTPVTIATGHRVGNFKPSVPTLEALREAVGAEPAEAQPAP